MLIPLGLISIAAADSHPHHLSMYTWSNGCVCNRHKLKNLKIKQSREECKKKGGKKAKTGRRRERERMREKKRHKKERNVRTRREGERGRKKRRYFHFISSSEKKEMRKVKLDLYY